MILELENKTMLQIDYPLHLGLVESKYLNRNITFILCDTTTLRLYYPNLLNQALHKVS